MNVQRLVPRFSLLCCMAILLSACGKKQNVITTNSDNTVNSYDFYWESDYPNAQSLVVFKTKDVPEGAALSWYVNGIVHETNNFSYRFPKGGKYLVKMVVDKDDAHGVTKEVLVAPASAYVEYSGVRVTGETIYFTSHRTDGGNHTWDFGDGSSSNANDPNHIYTKPGKYIVRLEVTGLEDKPMTAATSVEIVDDPVHTANMTNNRTWEITTTDFNLPANTSNTLAPYTSNFALEYKNKIEVAFPASAPIHGSISYNAKASTGNLLVFTRSFGISSDTLIYDHVADTIYCKGTTWNVPPGSKSTNGTGSTYVLRAQ